MNAFENALIKKVFELERAYPDFLQRIHHISPITLPFSFKGNPQNLVKMVVAQALLDNISPAIDGLIVRSIIPNIDFKTKAKYWKQPSFYTYPENNIDYLAYLADDETKNGWKVMLIYGFLDLERDKPNYVSYIRIEKLHKVVEYVDTNLIKQREYISLEKPYLSMAGDTTKIYFGLNDQAMNNYSRIVPLGIVCERLGENLV